MSTRKSKNLLSVEYVDSIDFPYLVKGETSLAWFKDEQGWFWEGFRTLSEIKKLFNLEDEDLAILKLKVSNKG